MTDIKQLAKNLRRYNARRRGTEGVEMPIPKDLSKWIEEAANALDCLTEPEPIKCETCEGAGKIDEGLGGYHTSNANVQCPDCDGAGYLESIHDFRPGQWWVKELDGIQTSQEATPDQKRAVAVVHNLLRHILKLERTERTAVTEGAQAEEALPGNVLARRVERLAADRDALAAELKALGPKCPSYMPDWPNHGAAIADPVFQQIRGIMGTQNFGQDDALRQAVLHALRAFQRGAEASNQPAEAGHEND